MNYWQWLTDDSGDGVVSRDEVRVLSQRGVALYDGDAKTNWTNGTLTLTSHKLIYADAASAAVLLLPLSTTSSSGDWPSCSRGLAFRSDKILLPLPAGSYCRLSFRDGGMRAFHEALVRVLRQQQWRNKESSSSNGGSGGGDRGQHVDAREAKSRNDKCTTSAASAAAGTSSSVATTAAAPTSASDTTSAAAATQSPPPSPPPALRDAHALGVAGIVRASAESTRVRETLADIDDVMRKASTLVEGIRMLRQRATAAAAAAAATDGSSSGAEAAAATTAADLLALDSIEATLGLGTLVTRPDAAPLTRLVAGSSSGSSSSSSSSSFHAELANELHAWLTHPRNAARLRDTPIMPLIELFALYNRARSGDLVSPDDVLGACKQLHKRPGGSAYVLTTFASGRMALVHQDRSLLLLRLSAVLGPRLVPSHAPHATPTPPPPTARLADGSVHVPVSTTIPCATTLASIDDARLATLLRVAVPVAQDVLRDMEAQGYLCSSDLGFGCSAYHWNIFVW